MEPLCQAVSLIKKTMLIKRLIHIQPFSAVWRVPPKYRALASMQVINRLSLPPCRKSLFFCALRIVIMLGLGIMPFKPLDGLTNLLGPPITGPANPCWPGHQLFSDKLIKFSMPHACIVQYRRQPAPCRVIFGQGLDAWLCPSRDGRVTSRHGEPPVAVHGNY